MTKTHVSHNIAVEDLIDLDSKDNPVSSMEELEAVPCYIPRRRVIKECYIDRILISRIKKGPRKHRTKKAFIYKHLEKVLIRPY